MGGRVGAGARVIALTGNTGQLGEVGADSKQVDPHTFKGPKVARTVGGWEKVYEA